MSETRAKKREQRKGEARRGDSAKQGREESRRAERGER